MIKISPCCHASIVEGSKREYPLGGTTWYESFKIDVCDLCGEEVEYALLQDEETGEILGAVS